MIRFSYTNSKIRVQYIDIDSRQTFENSVLFFGVMHSVHTFNSAVEIFMIFVHH